MKFFDKKIVFSTHKKYEVKDLTEEVINTVNESGISNGTVMVFARHATCAIILNENENGLLKDYVKFIKKIVSDDYEHDRIDNNASAHIASALLSQHKSYPVIGGEVVKGTWQDCLFVELDGPRSNREVIIHVVGD